MSSDKMNALDPNFLTALACLLPSLKADLKKGKEQEDEMEMKELVKVLGLSNYHCKLLSPVLTRYGMDKQSGKAKLLRDMNQGQMFDCSLLGDRAFLIEPDHVSTAGYGKDRSGSLVYLHDTLEEIKKANGNRECLVPVHVDGDGHCLVHAVSRALVGRELFWHALRENLKHNFKRNLDRYKALFQDFISDAAEWEDIIKECDPNFTPPDGMPLGLRNIHIFGLANVLHRPIILLDSLKGMKNSGDYSATFLPGLLYEDSCKGKDGGFNKPICIAWSSSDRDHIVPLVGIKHTVLPVLPAQLLPKAWGVPQELIRRYIRLEPDDSCVIGGDRGLQDGYLMRLGNAMDQVFMEDHGGVHPSLVAEYHHQRYTESVGVKPEEVTEEVRRMVSEHRLYRCTLCRTFHQGKLLPAEWLAPGGKYYNHLKSYHGRLEPDTRYRVTLEVWCTYDPQQDMLLFDDSSLRCSKCLEEGFLRQVCADGSVAYQDGDRTSTRTTQSRNCLCGFKHYYWGREYDNLPEWFPITLEWGGRAVKENVYWFQYEADASLNSNVYDVATRLVDKHFLGEFGSETLVQRVVNRILLMTQMSQLDHKPMDPYSEASRQNSRQELQRALALGLLADLCGTGEQ